MNQVTVSCACGREMGVDSLRGHGAFRCGCGARVIVATATPARGCAGYNEGKPCDSTRLVRELPIDLCETHAGEFMRALYRAVTGTECDGEELEDEIADTVMAWHERLVLAGARPQVESYVYYLRFSDRIKIGTTADWSHRLAGGVPYDEVLAREPGSYELERFRKLQFRHLRIRGEWFRPETELLEHIAVVRESHADLQVAA